jgi:hypothetical protein
MDQTTTLLEKLSEASWRAVPQKAYKVAKSLQSRHGPVESFLGDMSKDEADAMTMFMSTQTTRDKPILHEKMAQTLVAIDQLLKEAEIDLGLPDMDIALGMVKGALPLSQDQIIQNLHEGRIDQHGASTAADNLVAYDKVHGGNYPGAPMPGPHGNSPLLTGAAELSGYLPGGQLSWSVPGVPKHLQGMLAGGLLGAGAGYGLGWLGSSVLPAKWNKKRLPRTLAAVGGLIGAAPGLVGMGVNLASGKGVLNDSAFDVGPIPKAAGAEPKSRFSSSIRNLNTGISPILIESIKQAFSEAGYGTGYDIDLSPTPISMDALNHSLFNDPRVSSSLPLPLRAATSGVVETAWNARGQGPRFVTPADMAYIAAGMGSGYVSGAIVGKTLGILTGMPEETQDKLKQVGLWSGVVANVVPLLFRN